MDKYYWTYQCHRCFIKSGYGFTGTESEAYNNAPTCCGGEPMHPIRGNKIKSNGSVEEGDYSNLEKEEKSCIESN